MEIYSVEKIAGIIMKSLATINIWYRQTAGYHAKSFGYGQNFVKRKRMQHTWKHEVVKYTYPELINVVRPSEARAKTKTPSKELRGSAQISNCIDWTAKLLRSSSTTRFIPFTWGESILTEITVVHDILPVLLRRYRRSDKPLDGKTNHGIHLVLYHY